MKILCFTKPRFLLFAIRSKCDQSFSRETGEWELQTAYIVKANGKPKDFRGLLCHHHQVFGPRTTPCAKSVGTID